MSSPRTTTAAMPGISCRARTDSSVVVRLATGLAEFQELAAGAHASPIDKKRIGLTKRELAFTMWAA